MSTRGLIGYRATKRRDNTNNVFGIYNHESSEFIYKGLDVLEIYCDHLKKDFIDIFKSKTWDNSVDAHVNDTLSIFSLKKRKILKLFKFLTKRCFCEYAYIYNLQTGELEVYETIKNKLYFKNQYKYESNYYLNLAFIVNRENVHFILNLFYYSLRLGDNALIRMYMRDLKNKK